MQARLVAAARELLAELPYEQLTMDAVIERAGVSRGGLYHHFPDRRALFAAVNEQLNEELLNRVGAAADPAAPAASNLRAAAAEFVKTCTNPVVAKILLLEAPAVLGQQSWLEEAHARWSGIVQAMLEACAREGATLPGDTETLAHLLLSAIDGVGLLVAQRPELEPRAQATVAGVLDRILGFDRPGDGSSAPS